jgi:Zn-dependent protease
MTGSVTPALNAQPAAPEPICNCPDCSRYLPQGTIACPECHAIIYAGHLRGLALQATTAESEKHWAEARAIWVQTLAWLPPDTKQAEAVNAKIAALDARAAAEQDWQAKWTKRLGPFAPVLFFLVKMKSFFFLLLKFKFFLSFFAFFGLYWALFDWPFALGFSISILVHEMGHYLAAKRRGLKVDLPVFLPGLGAYVRWYAQGMTLETLSSIALAGPFFGLLFGVGCAVMVVVVPDPHTKGLFSALAHVTGWLNTLNLIPVLGLDGAQATYALNKTQRWLILATSLIFAVWLHEGVFVLVAAGMGWRLWEGGYPERPSSKTLIHYVLLLFALGIMMLIFPVPEQIGR